MNEIAYSRRMKRILLVDDDGTCKNNIVDNIKKDDSFQIESTDRKSALKLIENKDSYSLVIFNNELMDPISLMICREIRRISSIPVIVLCSRHEEIYELYAFEMGIDDFIRKPFNPLILIARINAILNRGGLVNKEIYNFNEIELDISGHTISIKGMRLNLRPKEFDLLKYLVEHQEIALRREQILQNVWNYDYVGYQRTIDTHIKKLRKKLGEKGSYIQTVRNIGYKLTNKNI